MMNECSDWTVDQTCDWVGDVLKELSSIDDEEIDLYKKKFKENGIDGKCLNMLNKDDYEEMGIKKIGHRKFVQSKITELYGRKRKRSLKGVKDSSLEKDVLNKDSLERNYKKIKVSDVMEEGSLSKKGSAAVSSKGKEKKVFYECGICMDDELDFSEMKVLKNCQDRFCSDCFKQYVESEIKQKRFPIKCPNDKCKKDLDVEEDILTLYPGDQKKREIFERTSLRSLVEKDPNSFCTCPTKDCGYIFIYDKGSLNNVDHHFRCEKCGKSYCLKCKCRYHNDVSCVQYRKWKLKNGRGGQDRMFLRYIKSNNIKSCPVCNRYVQKQDGCDYMICFCGISFCYECGQTFAACKCGGIDIHKDEHGNEI